jgi:plastocyanin
VAGVSACGSNGFDPPPLPPACAANTICMTSAAFYTTPTSSPPSVSVQVGTAVAWTNTSDVRHNVTFATPTAANAVNGGTSGNIPPHTIGTSSRVFTTPGTENFECTLHPGMAGRVVVQ